MRSELQVVLDSLRTMPTDKLPDLLGELEVIRATALMRLSSPMSRAETPDELVTVEQASQRLGVSKDYLYRHQLPFRRRMGRKLVFSSQGMDEYIRKTHPK